MKRNYLFWLKVKVVMSGLRLVVAKSKRSFRCESVTLDRTLSLIIFIAENDSSHRYVVPNLQIYF